MIVNNICGFRFVLFVIIVCFICSISSAQTDKISAKSPKQAIKELKEGTLVFFLRSHQKKIEELEKMRLNKNTTERKKVEIEVALLKLQAQNQTDYTAFHDAMDSLYSFSNYVFSFDYELKKIQDNNFTINCIDRDNKIFSCQLEKPFYMAVLNRSDPKESTNLDSWKILDPQFNKIPKPFPQNFKVAPFTRFMRSVFGEKEKNPMLNASTIAKKMNEKFHKFYFELAQKSF